MRILSITLMALTIALSAGCNRAKSPDAVAHDVDVARQKAAAEVAHRENQAQKDLTSEANKVDDRVVSFNNEAAKDAYTIAVAKADGNRRVALAKCDALDGDAQKTCKDQAEANYDAARADAKAQALAIKQ
jgi:hypothetical protein